MHHLQCSRFKVQCFFVHSGNKANTVSESLGERCGWTLWFFAACCFELNCSENAWKGPVPIAGIQAALHTLWRTRLGCEGGKKVDLSAGIISPRVAPLSVDTFVSRASPDTKAGPGKGMSWCWGKDNCLRSFPSAGPALLGFLASFASVAIQTAVRHSLAVISSCFSRCCSFLFPQFDAGLWDNGGLRPGSYRCGSTPRSERGQPTGLDQHPAGLVWFMLVYQPKLIIMVKLAEKPIWDHQHTSMPCIQHNILPQNFT